MNAAAKPHRRGFFSRLAAIDDGKLIRTAFFAMLIGTAAVLYIDYNELAGGEVSVLGLPALPTLPFFDPNGPPQMPGPEVTTDRALLDAPLTIALKGGGVLELTGTIDLGAAERFTAEIDAHAEYIKTVALNSPGGSLMDALAIGNVLRAHGLDTSVAKGELCASSCPLIFAAGKTRTAETGAAVGVHQFSALIDPGEEEKAPATTMSDAQRVTADITRYLASMDVDPALWLHALETPPNRIYYFSEEEMREYRLVTGASPHNGGDSNGKVSG